MIGSLDGCELSHSLVRRVEGRVVVLNGPGFSGLVIKIHPVRDFVNVELNDLCRHGREVVIFSNDALSNRSPGSDLTMRKGV